jgi:hypothetical protein
MKWFIHSEDEKIDKCRENSMAEHQCAICMKYHKLGTFRANDTIFVCIPCGENLSNKYGTWRI